MNQFNEHSVIRDELVDGVGPWVWVKGDGTNPNGDGGAWGGPKDDWENHHKANVLKYCKKFDTVLQAGGNCGMYPRLYSRMFNKVYTFEPDPMNFYCLVQNCQERNIVKIQAALAHVHTMIDVIHHNPDNVGMHTIAQSEDSVVPCFRIDDLDFKTLDLIHLDVEHAEEYAIGGAVETIQKHRPMLMLENGKTENITKFLESIKYKYVGNSVSDAIWLPE